MIRSALCTALSAALQAAATALAADTPGLIARSYQQAWRPNIVDRVVELAREVHGVHYWAAHVESNLDSGRVVSQSSDRLRELESETAQLSRASDSLQVADGALRSRIVDWDFQNWREDRPVVYEPYHQSRAQAWEHFLRLVERATRLIERAEATRRIERAEATG